MEFALGEFHRKEIDLGGAMVERVLLFLRINIRHLGTQATMYL